MGADRQRVTDKVFWKLTREDSSKVAPKSPQSEDEEDDKPERKDDDSDNPE